MKPRTRTALERMAAQRLDGRSRPGTTAPELVTWELDAGVGAPGPARASSRRPWVVLSAAVVATAAVLGVIALTGHDGAATDPGVVPGFAGAPPASGGSTCSPSPTPSPTPTPSPRSTASGSPWPSAWYSCTGLHPGQQRPLVIPACGAITAPGGPGLIRLPVTVPPGDATGPADFAGACGDGGAGTSAGSASPVPTATPAATPPTSGVGGLVCTVVDATTATPPVSSGTGTRSLAPLPSPSASAFHSRYSCTGLYPGQVGAVPIPVCHGSGAFVAGPGLVRVPSSAAPGDYSQACGDGSAQGPTLTATPSGSPTR